MIKRLTDRTKEGQEKKRRKTGPTLKSRFLGRDKRRNVIFSKQKVIEVEWKGMDFKPSTLKRLQGLCEEKGREVQKREGKR